jgi:MEMO1 family protein
MSNPQQPRLRRVESFPISEAGGQVVFALRDPEGFSGAVVVPYAAAVLASLMDGSRTLEEIRAEFERQFRQPLDLQDVEQLVSELDNRYFLDSDRFRARWKIEIEHYLNNPVRPAAHAGGAYSGDPEALRKQLAGLFTCDQGPGAPIEQVDTPISSRLCGVLSPHIDLHRGGPAFAWAYKKIIEESQADLFVIFGTAHNPMRNLFSVTRKHFETPLGTVETDRRFVAQLTARLKATPGGEELNLSADELAHRQEHSIEFQAVFLQYLLAGRRPFKIVPVLTGSFHDFVVQNSSPANSPQVAAFISAMQQTASQHAGKICFISGGDLAHIGQRFGDRAFLDQARLIQQAENDRELLAAACRADADGFFNHIAQQQDRHRICGLSPTYTMLQVMKPRRGELLRYDQAVELDGTSCVSFASLAFYDE